jgi:hypothetical protein
MTNKAILFFLILCIVSFNTFSQDHINDYKYVIVPNQYGFLKEKDQYQLNSLTKFLFNKYGYIAFMQEDELPDDLNGNRCLALYVNTENEKGLFKTKLKINLNDCNGNLVMASKLGETREKEYSKAYNLALRDAFETYQNLNYKYQPNTKVLARGKPIKADKEVEKSNSEIERLQKEIEALKEEKETVKVEAPKVAALVKTELVKGNTPKRMSKPTEGIAVLYAQPIDHGFQIVDSTPKVVMVILETSKQNVFLVKDENAIVYKEDGFWYYSKNDGKAVSIKTLNIKF